MAAARSARSNVELIKARHPGTKNAAPSPWMTRAAISMAGEVALAASSEPVPKVISPKRMTGTRPKRSEMEPPGRIMAACASR